MSELALAARVLLSSARTSCYARKDDHDAERCHERSNNYSAFTVHYCIHSVAQPSDPTTTPIIAPTNPPSTPPARTLPTRLGRMWFVVMAITNPPATNPPTVDEALTEPRHFR